MVFKKNDSVKEILFETFSRLNYNIFLLSNICNSLLFHYLFGNIVAINDSFMCAIPIF